MGVPPNSREAQAMAVTGGGAPPWAPQYVQEADVPMATARRRPRRSIGFRLLLPIAVATIGVGVLGGVQTSSALDAAREAESSGAVAQALTATVKLNHQLEQELSETEALLQ